MSRTSTYLNFGRNTEEAFRFYSSAFGNECTGIMRFGDMPASEGAPQTAEADLKLLVHIELEILGGHVLMGTDAPESMGFKLNMGNNAHINLEPDTLKEAQRLFDALSAGGKVGMPLAPMFWGGVFGSFTDQFGMQWMVNCASA
jgi:PhnB protein